jgi:integrase/recombinase XerD
MREQNNPISAEVASAFPAGTVGGGDRKPVSQLVHPDVEHVESWLGANNGLSRHTRRSYQREAFRFLAWMMARHGAAVRFSTVSGLDAMHYVQFLRGPGAVPHSILSLFGFSEQPWKKPLNGNSLGQAITILSGLYESLRRTPDRHGRPVLELNPFYGARRKLGTARAQPSDRALPVETWHAVMETIETLDAPAHRVRCRWLFLLAYYSFLRAHEMANLRMGDFVKLPSGQWMVDVFGKGAKHARIAAPPVLVEELTRYRLARGLPTLPVPGERTPAVLPIRANVQRVAAETTLSAQSIYVILKALFAHAAQRHPEHAAVLTRASTHWMRHTGITHTLDSGLVEPRYVQKQARHAHRNTTDLYDNRPAEAISRAFAGVGAPPPRLPDIPDTGA